MTNLKLRVLVGACAAFLLSAPIRADIIGSIWENDPTGAGNATPANVPGTPANVTFDLPGTSINFTSAGGYTIGDFLSSGGATITSGSADANNTLLNTIFDITGQVTVTNGQMFTAGHDDGLTFTIGSDAVINAPGPTGFVNTPGTYTGPSGTFNFQIVYGECCGAPADLKISGFNLVSTPEPSAAIPAFFGLLFMVVIARKRFAKAL